MSMEINRDFARKILDIAQLQLQQSIEYKKPRIIKIDRALDMLASNVQLQQRQLFNVPLPILKGFYDTLLADLDDPITIKVKKQRQQEPSCYRRHKQRHRG